MNRDFDQEKMIDKKSVAGKIPGNGFLLLFIC